jgi:hypothetical protein
MVRLKPSVRVWPLIHLAVSRHRAWFVYPGLGIEIATERVLFPVYD